MPSPAEPSRSGPDETAKPPAESPPGPETTSSPAGPSSNGSAPPSDSSPPTAPPADPPASPAPAKPAATEPTNILEGTGWEWRDLPVGGPQNWTWVPPWLLPAELRPGKDAEGPAATTSESKSAVTVPGQEWSGEPMVHRVGSKGTTGDAEASTGSRPSVRLREGVWSSEEELPRRGHFTLRLERAGGEPEAALSHTSLCSLETPAKFLISIDAEHVSFNQYHTFRPRH